MKINKQLHATTYKRFGTQYKPILINHRVELCEALKLKNHPLYNYFFYKSDPKATNLYEPCPFKVSLITYTRNQQICKYCVWTMLQGHKYVKPYYTSYEILPPLLPVGTWRCDIRLTKGLEEEVFKFTNYYEISGTGLLEF